MSLKPMLTLYGKLEDDGDSWLFIPASRLDACAPDFLKAVRLQKTDVLVGTNYGLDSVRIAVETAKEVGLLPRPTFHNTAAAMYVP